MANTPLPQRLLAFLNPDGKTVALPWWRWFQQFEGGTGTGTPGPEGPAGPQGPEGPAGSDTGLEFLNLAGLNAQPSLDPLTLSRLAPPPPPALDPLALSHLAPQPPSADPLTLLSLSQRLTLIAGSNITLTPGSPAYGGAVTIAATAGGTGTVTSVSLSGPLGGGTVTTSGTLGTSSYTAHGVLVGNSTSALNVTGAGSSGQRLRVPAGGGDPAFASTALLTIIQRTTNQSISNNTTTTISWDTTAVQDDVSAFSGASPTILTVPSGYTKVRITAYTCWAANSTGPRGMHIDKNGTVLEGCQFTAANESPMHFTTRWLTVAASDTLSLGVFQQSGGALNFVGTTNFFTQPPYIQAEWAA